MKPNVLVGHIVPGKEKSLLLVNAFIAGAPPAAEGAVFYGIVPSMAQTFRDAQMSGKPWYYIDNAYFDCARGTYFRVTKSRLQHDGSGPTSGKRLAELGVHIQPVRRGGDYVLALEQSPAFMRHVVGQPGWLTKALYGVAPVRMRAWSSDKPRLGTTFKSDLKRASMVVTYSSAGAVEAACAGVPVAVGVASAAYCFNGGLPSEDERARWAGVLADNPFTIEEMRSGKAWRALNP